MSAIRLWHLIPGTGLMATPLSWHLSIMQAWYKPSRKQQKWLVWREHDQKWVWRMSLCIKGHLRVCYPNYLSVTHRCIHMGQSETMQVSVLNSVACFGEQIICNPWPKNSGCHFLRCCCNSQERVGWLGWWYKDNLVLELRSPGDIWSCERPGLLFITDEFIAWEKKWKNMSIRSKKQRVNKKKNNT